MELEINDRSVKKQEGHVTSLHELTASPLEEVGMRSCFPPTWSSRCSLTWLVMSEGMGEGGLE